jgi:hypothetical protein
MTTGDGRILGIAADQPLPAAAGGKARGLQFIARGIPCVSDIPVVTRLLRDGDVVRLDGSTGLVTVVARGVVQPSTHCNPPATP